MFMSLVFIALTSLQLYQGLYSVNSLFATFADLHVRKDATFANLHS